MTDVRARVEALPPEARASLAEKLANGRRARALPRLGVAYFGDMRVADPRARYDFVLETARLADRLGFVSIWTPERHFHSFGGLYPNPSVLGAALATTTRRAAIRAGSLVCPLHHPLRICEDWSVVDNLSDGRVGIALASGWHESDFAIAPAAFATRRETTFESVSLLRRLWRGEELSWPGPAGKTGPLKVFPPPVQAELPLWITSSGNAGTWARAGEMGTNVYTALIGQTPQQLAANVERYRAARAAAGHDPRAGTVTLMLHAFARTDAEEARRTTRPALREYLRGHLAQQAGSGPATTRDVDVQVEFAVTRFHDEQSLIGDPAAIRAVLERVAKLGVDEVACLVDFGVGRDEAAESLELLADAFVKPGRTEAAS